MATTFRRLDPPPPPPMPGVAQAQQPLTEAAAAIERGLRAWNTSQLQDALRSASYFIVLAEESLARQSLKDQQP